MHIEECGRRNARKHCALFYLFIEGEQKEAPDLAQRKKHARLVSCLQAIRKLLRASLWLWIEKQLSLWGRGALAQPGRQAGSPELIKRILALRLAIVGPSRG